MAAGPIQFGAKDGESWRRTLRDDCTWEAFMAHGADYLAKGPGKSMRKVKTQLSEAN